MTTDPGPTHIRTRGWRTICGLMSGETRLPDAVSLGDARGLVAGGYPVRWCPVCAREALGLYAVQQGHEQERDCRP